MKRFLLISVLYFFCITGFCQTPVKEKSIIHRYDIRISPKGINKEDRVYVLASTDAKDEYETGYDVAKLGELRSNTSVIWVKAYGINLATCYTPLSDGTAYFDLSIYAPADGIYNIRVDNYKNNGDDCIISSLYLTKNGEVIADITDGDAYSLTLKKGITDKYGLYMTVDLIPNAETITQEDSVNTDDKPIKVIEGGKEPYMVIYRGGEKYDLSGRIIN